MDDNWKVRTAVCWGQRDRWLSYDGVEDFCKDSKHQLIQLPMVRSIPLVFGPDLPFHLHFYRTSSCFLPSFLQLQLYKLFVQRVVYYYYIFLNSRWLHPSVLKHGLLSISCFCIAGRASCTRGFW